jgi:hypothetical protein
MPAFVCTVILSDALTIFTSEQSPISLLVILSEARRSAATERESKDPDTISR